MISSRMCQLKTFFISTLQDCDALFNYCLSLSPVSLSVRWAQQGEMHTWHQTSKQAQAGVTACAAAKVMSNELCVFLSYTHCKSWLARCPLGPVTVNRQAHWVKQRRHAGINFIMGRFPQDAVVCIKFIKLWVQLTDRPIITFPLNDLHFILQRANYSGIVIQIFGINKVHIGT